MRDDTQNSNGFAMKNRQNARVIGWCCLVAALLGPFSSASAQNVGYKLILSEDKFVLLDPDNPSVCHMAAWQTQHMLLVERNMPYIELRNTSDVGSITEFSMSVGALSDNIDFAQLIEASAGVTFNVDSSLPNSADGIPNGLKGDNLHIKFSGLTPGSFVRFQIDLDPDGSAVNPLIDYREVLFDMNGSNALDNSRLSVLFDSLGHDTMLSQFIPDFAVNMPTFTGLSFRSHFGTDHVQAFVVADSAAMQVPEPSTALLLALGAIGCTAAVRCRSVIARKSRARLG